MGRRGDRPPRYVRLRVRGCSRTTFTVLDVLLLAAIASGGYARVATNAEIAAEIGCYAGHVRDIALRLERAGLIDVVGIWREDGGRDANAWSLTAAGEEVLAVWPDAAGADVDGLPEWARAHVGAGALAGVE